MLVYYSQFTQFIAVLSDTRKNETLKIISKITEKHLALNCFFSDNEHEFFAS